MSDLRLTFPRIQARNLEGRTFNLPADFAGERNVVLIAFKQWHQSIVDGWMPQLKELKARRPGLQVYELPTISNLYALGRPFIDGGMAMAIPNKATRETTLTVYIDLRRVTEPLKISNTDTITIVLVDRAGQVFWRGQGDYDPAQMAELARATDSMV